MGKIVELVETTDYADGELKESHKSKVVYLPAEKDYSKFYGGSVGYLVSLPDKGLKIALLLASEMSYIEDGLIIKLTTELRRKICDLIGISPKTLQNELAKLQNGKVLFRVEKNVYQMNPFLFSKGKSAQIIKFQRDSDYFVPPIPYSDFTKQKAENKKSATQKLE